MAEVILIEADAADPASGATKSVRLAGGGRRGYTHKGRTDWRAGVAALPRYASAIGFDQSGPTGAGAPTSAKIGFAGSLGDVSGLYWTGAPIVVSTGDDRLTAPAWTVELTGTVTAIEVDDAAMSLTVADSSAALYVTALPASFAGTGGIEGGADAVGRPKRRSWGRCFNVEGRLLSAADNIYEFGDTARPLKSFLTVKDKGAEGVQSTVVAWAGSIAATFDALRSASAPQGGAVVAPSIACAKWWTRPVGPLTADIEGDAAGNYPSAIGDVFAAIVAAYQPTMTVAGVAASNAARPGLVGIHADDTGETVAMLLDRLLLPASSFWVVGADGVIGLRSLGFSRPVERLVAAARPTRQAVFAPLGTRKVGYRRNHRQHSDSEISATLTGSKASDVTYDDGKTVEDLKPAQKSADVTAQNVARDVANVGGTPTASFVSTLHDAYDDIDRLQFSISASIAPAVSQLQSDLTTTRGTVQGILTTQSGIQSDVGNVRSSVTTEAGARSSADQALSGRIDSVNASVGSVAASVTSEAGTRAGADQALGYRIDTVTTAAASNSSQITTEIGARTSADAALAYRIDNVSSSIVIRPNLQPNGGFADASLAGSQIVPAGGGVSTGSRWGRAFTHTSAGASALWMPLVQAFAGDTMTASYDYLALSGTTRVDVVFYTGSNGTGSTTYGPSSPNGGPKDFQDDVRQSWSFTVPSNCQSIQLRLVSENVSSGSLIGFRRVKLEKGGVPSLWTDEGAAISIYASVSSEAAARASADAAIAYNVTNLTSRMGSAEASISSQSKTIASHSASIASISTTVQAISPVTVNLVLNPTFSGGSTTGWTLGGSWAANGNFNECKFSGTGGTSVNSATAFTAASQAYYSLQLEAWTPGLRGGALNLDLVWLDSGGNVLGYSNRLQVTQANGNWTRYALDGQNGGIQAPQGAVKAVARVFLEGSTTDAGGSVAFRRVQVEKAGAANPWVDYVDGAALEAKVQQNAAAIADIQNNKLAAYWQVQATAGTASASISAIAQSGGTTYSAIELIAAQFSVRTSAGATPVLAVSGTTVVINGNLVATSSLQDNAATSVIAVVSSGAFAGDGGGGSYTPPSGGRNGGQLQ